MAQAGTYNELLEGSESFGRLLENIHQREQEEEQEQQENGPESEARRATRCMTISKKEDEDRSSSNNEKDESKGEGSVKYGVYSGYLKAAVNMPLGILLLVVAFGVREVVVVLYSRWLGDWSEDETLRHRYLTNCTSAGNAKVTMIRAMSEPEWNEYRNNRFYVFSGGNSSRVSGLNE